MSIPNFMSIHQVDVDIFYWLSETFDLMAVHDEKSPQSLGLIP